MIFWLVILLCWCGLANGQNLFDRLIGDETPRNLGGGQVEFLDPEEAFRFTYQNTEDALELSWDIAPGYYLYRDRFKLQPESQAASAEFTQLPTGEMKDDPEFGRVEIYREQLTLSARLNAPSHEAAEQALTVTYQGCAEDGICYPPIKKTVRVAAVGPAVAAAGAGTRQTMPNDEAPGVILSADKLASRLSGQSLPSVLSVFFGFGLLLSFTPCVFPMIPILSGIIVGQKAPVTTGKAFRLSLTYVLAMASTYAVVGVIAGIFGHNLQASFQQPQWIIGFSVVFVLLALSMFGFYQLELPQAWQTKLDQVSRSQKGGSYLGVAIMGVLSAIIVGPCVAPPFAAALLYLSHQGSPLVGGLALFSMALGMGALLLLVGTAAGRIVPRSGGWMEGVKHFFGVVLLGVAIWFMARILPGALVLAAWAALCVISAVYLGVLEPVRHTENAGSVEHRGTSWRYFRKGLGALAMMYGALLLVGASVGGDDPLKPLAPLAAGNGGQHQELPFIAIKSLAELDQAVASARRDGKVVMLDFYADWCVECKHLEKNTFADPEVQKALGEVMLLRADVTANDEIDQALLKRFELFGPPAVLFFDRSGAEKRDYRVLGFLGPKKFLTHLNLLARDQQRLSAR